MKKEEDVSQNQYVAVGENPHAHRKYKQEVIIHDSISVYSPNVMKEPIMPFTSVGLYDSFISCSNLGSMNLEKHVLNQPSICVNVLPVSASVKGAQPTTIHNAENKKHSKIGVMSVEFGMVI